MKENEEISLEEIVNIFRRHYKLLIACALSGGILAAIGSFLAKPVYEAGILIQLTSDSSQNLLNVMNPALAQQQSRIYTYVELAQSKTVLERVCRKLEYSLEDGMGAAVKKLRGQVNAKIVRNTELISVTLRDINPERACNLANALGNELVAMSIERKQQESRQVREFLDTQVDKVRDDLLKSEANLSPRAVKVNEEVYRLLLSKRHEANIAEHSEIGELAVIDTADIPDMPVRPRKRVNTLLGLILGCMIGLASAFWRERQVSGIENIEELEELSDVPVLGSVPLIKIPAGADWLAHPEALLGDRDKTGHLEPYRMIAANLELVRSGKARKILLVTSAVPGEGKSRTSACLGLVLAKEGRKVLVVEGDLRRPMLGGLWKLSGPGLAGVLSGKAHLNDALQTPDSLSPFFSVLPAGSAPLHPAELLGEEPLKKLFEEIKARFDIILVDSSPVLLTPDALKLAGVVDGILMVVEASATPRKLLSRALKQLERAETALAGVILNKLPERSSLYGSYYGRYYGKREKAVEKTG